MPAQSLPPHVKGLQGSYDGDAAQYDAERYHSPKGKLFTDLETALLRSWLGLGRGSKVLDIPAGTGRFSKALAQSGATVVGLDVSLGMLQQAAAKGAGEADLSLYFSQGDGLRLPFADNTFDAVISFKFFHLIPNEMKRQFIDEMVRVLKPGRPLVVEFNSPYYGGVLAFLRYWFRKKHPGGMRMKCLFPDQVAGLFSGMDVTRKQGVQLPFAVGMRSLLGSSTADALGDWLGRVPGIRYLLYAVVIEARKRSAHA